MTKDDQKKLLYLNLKGFTIQRSAIMDKSKFIWRRNGELCTQDGLIIRSISEMYFYECD